MRFPEDDEAVLRAKLFVAIAMVAVLGSLIGYVGGWLARG